MSSFSTAAVSETLRCLLSRVRCLSNAIYIGVEEGGEPFGDEIGEAETDEDRSSTDSEDCRRLPREPDLVKLFSRVRVNSLGALGGATSTEGRVLITWRSWFVISTNVGRLGGSVCVVRFTKKFKLNKHTVRPTRFYEGYKPRVDFLTFLGNGRADATKD